MRMLLVVAAWLTQSTMVFGSGWVTTSLAERADIGLSKMSMARDGDNNLYVAYRDVAGGDLKFADNTRGIWRTAVIAGGGDDASIAVDADGHSHVSYRNGTILYYATNASGAWETSALAVSAYMSDIALDPAGKVHISYFDYSNYRVRHATNASGDWVFTTVDDTLDSDSGYTSIGVDSYYYAHISYSFGNYYDEETHYELKYATNSSGDWAAFTINSSGHIGRDTSLALDSSDFVHIASYETEERSLQYTTNASGDWVTETADPGVGVSVGYRPSIGMDSGGYAHISYYASGVPQHLKYATNASGSWTQQTLDPYTLCNIGYNSSLVVDSDDYVHIAYDYNHQCLKYIRNTTGSFDLFDAYVIDGTDDPVGQWTSLALDAGGNPHVAYQNTYHLRYGYPDQGVWFVDQAVNGGNVGSYANLVLDGSGVPVIAYYDAQNYDLDLASFATGTWVVSILDGKMSGAISMTGDSEANPYLCYKNDDGWGGYPLTEMNNMTGVWNTTVLWDESHYGYSNSIAVDPRDIEHIAWYYNNAGGTERLNYATNASGSWANTQIDDAVGNVRIGGCCSVAVDSYYYAHISYYDADNGNLKYATNASGSWATQTLFSDGNTGLYNSIAVDGSAHAHVTYYFATAGCLMYATDASGAWVEETVDAAAGTGLYTSLALDADGLPRVSYYDLTQGRLKFAYLVLPSPTPSPTPEGYKTPTPSPSASPSPTPTRSPVPTPSAVPTASAPATPIPVPSPTAAEAGPAAVGDYNGDGTSDVALFRPSSGLWLVRGLTKAWFGAGSDEVVPSDYNGDGTWEVAVFRPSNGKWLVRGTTAAFYGVSTDLPVPGDYNGDGTADIALFRPALGKWLVRNGLQVYYGFSTDVLVPADYGGDGTTDMAVFRPGSGKWLVRGTTSAYYGFATDTVVPGDYTGDGAADMAVFRPSNGKWLVRGGPTAYFGNSSDTVQPADYDGDGTWDFAVFRSASGKWLVRGVTSPYYGASTDLPVTNP